MKCFVAILIGLLTAGAFAEEFQVPGDFGRIQLAINAAEDGDVIVVHPGVYYEIIDYQGKAIEIRSTDGPEVTTITARYLQGSVVTFDDGEGADSIIDGFELREGSGNCSLFFCYGGGIFCHQSSPTIRNCVIQDNAVDFDGGAIYVYEALPVIENCLIRNNRANWYNGGGIYVNGERLVVTDCVFESNNASAIYTNGADILADGCTFTANISDGYGGAIHAGAGRLDLRDCVFEFNRNNREGGAVHSSGGGVVAENTSFILNDGGGHGGAINCSGGGLELYGCTFVGNTTYGIGPGFKYDGAEPLVVWDCVFENNVTDAADGGAFEVAEAPVDIRDSVFRYNIAHSAGGGKIRGGSAPAFIVDCWFEKNHSTLGTGGGLRLERSSTDVINCTFIGNTTVDVGGAIDVRGSDCNIVNCIFSGNRGYWRGGAIDIDQAGNRIVNCLFSGNESYDTGGAICIDHQTLVANCIFRRDFSAWKSEISSRNGQVEFHPVRCNIDGWPIADLVVDEIPGCRDELGPDGLAGTGDEDFRSTSCSEGIDQGDQNLLPADRADIDGDGDITEPIPLDILGRPRVIDVPSVPNAPDVPGRDSAIDRGPFEFEGLDVPCLPDVDCDGNGIRDNQDILDCEGEAWCLDCNENGRPDVCDVMLSEPYIDPGNGYWPFNGDTMNFGHAGIDGELVGSASLGDDVGVDVVPGTGASNTGSLEINGEGFVRIRDPEQRYAMSDSSFTIEAWVRLDELGAMGSPSRRQYLLQRKPGDSTGWKMNYAFLVQGGNLPTIMDRRYGKTSGLSGRELILQFGGNGSTWCVTSHLEVEETGWHCVSVAMDAHADVVTFGLDGVFEAVPFQEEPRDGFEANLLIGAHQNSSGQMNQFLRGAIDELRITRRVLSASEQLNHWAIGTSGDCNGNGIPDGCDIANGLEIDDDHDGVPDRCVGAACPEDLSGDGQVNGEDLGLLFVEWGMADSAADLSGDGQVNGEDLGLLFVAWGSCGNAGCDSEACDDGDECTVDSCNPVTEDCQHRRLAGCITDLCFDVVCDDGDSCTEDACDPLTGECVFTLIEDCIPDPCKDVICNDGNPCTEDYCDSDTGDCVHEPIAGCEPAPCGDPEAGSCFTPKSIPNCDDLSCCESVCAIDDFCCSSIWDQSCVDLAKSICP